jgi:hypothetical protein
VNVQRWQTLSISLLLASSLLTGCASFGLPSFGSSVKPVEVINKARDKTALDIELPEPLKLKPMQWVVITPANQEEVFAQLEADGVDAAVFALTPDGYQSLAITISELRTLIATQRMIIMQYEDYYEPPKAEVKEEKK